MDAAVELHVEVMRAGSAWAGYRAYQNHREAGGELVESIWAGAVTARRWFTYFIMLTLWALYSAIMGFAFYMVHYGMPSVAPEYMEQTTKPGGFNHYAASGSMTTNMVIYGIATILLFGIQYCRIITGGLHRRYRLYYLFRTPYMLTLWCPSFFLYLIVFTLPLTWGIVV